MKVGCEAAERMTLPGPDLVRLVAVKLPEMVEVPVWPSRTYTKPSVAPAAGPNWMFELMTGAPQYIASIIGNPKPSIRDGNRKKSQKA